ncbi:MAG: Ig-like domain-containing protein [candidate division WOR-3 bacterium]
MSFSWRWLGVALLLSGLACELLLKDRTPPSCVITYPTDSTIVSGIVIIRAEAFDSSGVALIRFYVDNGLLKAESSNIATANWDTRNLSQESWHRLWCSALDIVGNEGYSDTVVVQVAQPGQRNVFHGELELAAGYYTWIGFKADTSDILAGDARALNGTISRFLWLSRSEFRKYRQHQSYTPLFQQGRVTEFNMREAVPTADSFYLVFENDSTVTKRYWARFVLE